MDLETLNSEFGKWCIALVPASLDDTLHSLRVEEPAPVANPILALEEYEETAANEVFLIARQICASWTLVLEIDGVTGWVAADATVLRTLSLHGQAACTAFKDPNKSGVLTAEAAGAVSGIDPETGRRWGSPSQELAERLNHAGFSPDGYGLTDMIAGQPPIQLALLAVEASTGIRLARKDFCEDWTGGFAATIP